MFINGFVNLTYAQDLEKSMDEKAAREDYYKQHSSPQIIDMDCEINGVETKPSYDPGVVGIGGNINLELGTK